MGDYKPKHLQLGEPYDLVGRMFEHTQARAWNPCQLPIIAELSEVRNRGPAGARLGSCGGCALTSIQARGRMSPGRRVSSATTWAPVAQLAEQLNC